MLKAVWSKNDKLANTLIISFSAIVFMAVVLLGRVQLKVDLGFDVHVFAKLNAIINSTVAILLLAGLVSVKNKKFLLHKRIMITAMFLSVLFLISYICHHVFSGETKFAGEGTVRYIYYAILISHIFLAAIILPFILFTAYRAMVGEFPRHKKLAKITWPIWFYVAVTGVVIYCMISPYYS